MLFLLRFTGLDKHFFALDFFTLLPKARDLKAWKAARFSLDPDCLTCWSASLISSASACKAFVSFSSRGVLTNPSSSKIFLVLGLCITVFNICAFFLVWPEAHVTLHQFRIFLRFCFEIQVIHLLSRNCSLLPFHGVFSLILLFFRLSSSAARLCSLISFALLPFWAFFMVNEPCVCRQESDSRLCFRFSLVFSINFSRFFS